MNFNIFLILLLGSLLMILEVKAQRRNTIRRPDDDAGLVPVTQQPGIFYPQPRIVSGTNANEGQFPYQISLRVGGSHICGGSIISKNYVVTAAHCTDTRKASELSIRAGSVAVNSGGQVVAVSAILNHPSYDPKTSKNNDIALLRLASPLQFNDRVKAVALASRAPRAGSQVVASGWGYTSNDGPIAQTLQYSTLTALSNVQCSQRVSRFPATVLCLAHPPGNGVCYGDSGGPAVYQNQLVGVANYVVERCGSNNPDGYASIAIHLEWLKNNSDV